MLEIITPEKIVMSEDIESLVCHADKGMLGILPGHADLLANLKPGELTIRNAASQHVSVKIKGGILEVNSNRITVLTESI